MEPKSLLAQARDMMTVRQVYGEPIERDGMTVIPVAKVMGGGGGGSSSGTPDVAGGDIAAEGNGGANAGGGFGFRAVPAGTYVINDGNVSWQPALDLNRVILGGQVAGIVLLLVIRSIVRVLAGRRGG